MWKQKPESTLQPILVRTPEPARPAPPTIEASLHPSPSASADQATLGQGLVVRGDITGVDSLYIDGTVEGTIRIPGERVTIGQSGSVAGLRGPSAPPCIVAREIILMGTVVGNIVASDRVDIRARASLTGDVSTARVSIEDGAYFRGGIDIRREQTPAEARPELEPEETVPA